MADGTGLLLKSWRNVYYRFGPFAPARLTACIEANMEVLSSLREQTIDSYFFTGLRALERWGGGRGAGQELR